MTVSMFQCHATPDQEVQPTIAFRVDDEGDIWIKFQESGYQTEIDIVLSPKQFKAFASSVEDLANSLLLAEVAEEMACQPK